jgi:uncharacterized damage-inducible protein DinB
MLEHFQRMLAYDTWANQRTVDSIRALPQPDAKATRLLAHLFSSKRMWLGRIRRNSDATITTWPELSLDETIELGEKMLREWDGYLNSLSEDDLRSEVHYEIKAVGPGMQTVGDIVTHKFMHAMYHRGQLATLVREAGGTPASTDFVVWAKALRESQEH